MQFTHPLQPVSEVINFIKSGGRLERPENCPEKVYTMIISVCKVEPRDRPMFKQLLEQLTKLVQSM